MSLTKRVLTLGAATLTALAIATPSFAQASGQEQGVASEQPTEAETTEAEEPTETEDPSEGNVECDEACQAERERRRKAREEKAAREAAEREAENQRLQAKIDREQAEADQLEEQARLCGKQPSRAACNPYASSVVQAKPAPPKPVSYVAAQQEKVARHGNLAGVGIRPVPDLPEQTDLEDAVDVPDTHQFALVDPAARPGPRNLVWFSFVSLAAISSLGYGLWRILFVEG